VAFFKTRAPNSTTRLDKSELLLCVGWKAFINWPNTGAREPLPLCDAQGEAVANDLCDGQEVEIVAWRPHAREGLSYQVRRLKDDSVWWIRALYLRRERHAA
jgi:hypothetical protein